MDMFAETIVKPKPSGKVMGIRLLIIFITALLIYLSLNICLSIQNMLMFLPLMVIGFGWLGWKFYTYFNYEYEYSVTNGILDIDRIVAKKARRKILTFTPEVIEIVAPYTDEYKREFDRGEFGATIDARISPENPGWFVIGTYGKKGRTRVIFEPTDRMLYIFTKTMPRKMPYMPDFEGKRFE